MVHDMINQAAYMAHGYCLLWKPWLVALHAGSDFLIFAAYFGADLPLLPDRSFTSASKLRPYDLTDITDRLPPP